MSNDYFRFKRFCIRHDQCAMKVGTDGVLLGAWGCVEGKHILDIGTGSGIIALMAAQRNPEATVLGIDIDQQAVLQAQENIAESPFADRVSCILQDVASMQSNTFFGSEKFYDAILCNPPFFTEDTLPDDAGRVLARNSKSLPFPVLVEKVAALLNENGRFTVIIPSKNMQDFVGLCLAAGLHLERRCIVRTKANKPPRRALLTFTPKNIQNLQSEELCLIADDESRSLAYKKLTETFYL